MLREQLKPALHLLKLWSASRLIFTRADRLKLLLQANYVNELAEVTGQEKCDTTGLISILNIGLIISEIFLKWAGHKAEDILTYRDKQFKSIFTGQLANKNQTRWIDDRNP